MTLFFVVEVVYQTPVKRLHFQLQYSNYLDYWIVLKGNLTFIPLCRPYRKEYITPNYYLQISIKLKKRKYPKFYVFTFCELLPFLNASYKPEKKINIKPHIWRRSRTKYIELQSKEEPAFILNSVTERTQQVFLV